MYNFHTSELGSSLADIVEASRPSNHIENLMERLRREVDELRRKAKEMKSDDPTEAERLGDCARKLKLFVGAEEADVRRRSELWECFNNIAQAMAFTADRLRKVP